MNLTSSPFMRRAALPTLTAAMALVAAAPPVAADQPAATPLGCGTVVTTDVRLQADLRDCPGSGLVVGAPGITVDLDGHTVDGTGSGAGIDNSAGHDDVRVLGGKVEGFLFGVELFEAGSTRLHRLVVGSNIDGVKIARSEDAVLDRVTVRDSAAFGVEVTFSDRVTVRRSTVSASGIGGLVDRYGRHNRHLGNRLVGNTGTGLTVDRTDGAVVAGNRSVANGGDGVELVGVEDALLVDNRAAGNAGNGFTLDSPGNRLTRNVARGNAGLGIAAPAGTVDGGGNRAYANLGGGCTGVACR